MEEDHLKEWLRVNPRGPGRYRSDLRCAVLSAADCIGSGIGEGDNNMSDVLSECRLPCASERYSLNKARKLHPFFANAPKLGRRSTGPLVHGDVVSLSAYRGVGYFICYGPSSDLSLVKTGSEYGYCIPIEFSDAPSEYFSSQCEVLREFALPSPLLLPVSACSRFKRIAAKLLTLQGKPIAGRPQVFGMYFENGGELYPTFSAEGDDGYFIASEEVGRLQWLDSEPTLKQYLAELAVVDRSKEVAGDDSGSDDDDSNDEEECDEEECDEEDGDDDEGDVEQADGEDHENKHGDRGFMRPERNVQRPRGDSGDVSCVAYGGGPPLASWLQSHPRGPGRYRRDGKCAFVSVKSVIRFPWDASSSPARDGSGEYSFFRLSLNKMIEQFPSTIFSLEAKRGRTSCGALQHGDVVHIPSDRFFEIFVCYGPADDLALIKTRQEDTYCIPPEFCDAPIKYFQKAAEFSERAFPIPSLLPRQVTLPPLADEVFKKLAELAGSKISPTAEYLFDSFSWWNRSNRATDIVPLVFCVDSSASPIDDGFLVIDDDSGILSWVQPATAAARFRQEVALADDRVESQVPKCHRVN